MIMTQLNFESDLPHPYNKIGDGPEGPEVAVTAEQLSVLIKNTKLIAAECFEVGKKCPKNMDDFEDDLPLKVIKVNVRGKIIYIILKSADRWWCIWCAFAMTGRFALTNTKHSRFAFKFKGKKMLKSGKTASGLDYIEETTYYTAANNFIIPNFLNGQREFIVYFESVRGFSKIELLETHDQLDCKLKTLEHSFLQDSITVRAFANTLQKHCRKNLAAVLLDAHMFTGIGNYIVAEALYKAKLSPFRKVNSLNSTDITRLYKAIKHIMKWSYLSQGGKKENIMPGIEVPKRLFTFAVYRQNRDPKGNLVTHEKIPTGRTGHWVKKIQK